MESAVDSRVDLLLQSVGTAQPSVVGVMHDALQLPREWIVDTIYRAPARLLPDLPLRDAQKLAGMLRGLGLQVETVAPGVQPERGPLFDVALRLVDPARADDVAIGLGRFLGLAPQQALELMLTPPSVVLGRVTMPTIHALQNALPTGAAELLRSQRDSARFALFAPQLDGWQRAAIKALLPAGTEFAEDGSLTCLDLGRQQAERLWRQLGASGKVRMVSQDFLRFTLVLTAVPADAAQAAAALQRLAGVPLALYDQLAVALPCPVAEAVPLAQLQERLQDFAAAGFGVRADLETFARAALDVRQASRAALDAVDIDATAPLVTAPMPRELARVQRARLRALGAEVYLV